MSERQVLESERRSDSIPDESIPGYNGIWFPRVDVNGFYGHLYYLFGTKGLIIAGYRFGNYPDIVGLIDGTTIGFKAFLHNAYNEMVRAITDKYGNPTSVEKERTTWELERTMIRVFLQEDECTVVFAEKNSLGYFFKDQEGKRKAESDANF
jgi:hypothetical protein